MEENAYDKEFLYFNPRRISQTKGRIQKTNRDTQVKTDQVWYFAISDCYRNTLNKQTKLSNPWTLHLSLTNEGSQFSQEDHGTVEFSVCMLLLLGFLFATNTYQLMQDAS